MTTTESTIEFTTESTLVGTSGFDYAYWHGIKSTPAFYPSSVKKKDSLSFYSQNFNLVEINSSFYKTPTVAACKNWFNATPDHFRFLLKFPRAFTHYFKDIDTVFQPFHQAVSELKHKLVGVLLQFGPNFIQKASNFERLKEAAKHFACADIQVYIELRHPTWFNNLNITTNLCKEFGWVLTITHTAKDGWLPKSMIQTCPGKIMVRMHGTWSHCHGEYNLNQLKDLAQNIESIPHKIITFNNTDTYDGQCFIKDVNDDAGRKQVMQYMSNYGWEEFDFVLHFTLLSMRKSIKFTDYILLPKTLDYINIHAIKNAIMMSNIFGL